MLIRVLGALVVAIIVGIVLVALLGPVLVNDMNKVPIAVTLGNFCITWGWIIGVLCGLWYLVSGSTWPRRA